MRVCEKHQLRQILRYSGIAFSLWVAGQVRVAQQSFEAAWIVWGRRFAQLLLIVIVFVSPFSEQRTWLFDCDCRVGGVTFFVMNYPRGLVS